MEVIMKECFIVTPIGGASSSIRREIDGLIQTVFAPVLDQFEIQCIAAHQISESGSITRQVVKKLIESELVIANLTNLNPNVMYELGIRHSTRKPTIVIAREDVVLPFDLSDERTIFYKNDISGVNELKDSLMSMIPQALEEARADNPVYRVVDVDLIKIPESTSEPDKVINTRLSQLEGHLEDISRILRTSVGMKPKYAFKRTEKRETDFRYYADESMSSDIEVFCERHSIQSHSEMVYKDVLLIELYPETTEQTAWIQKYELESGLKRI
ncbi:hypothetical protein ACED63_22045 [Vibrio splendidus]|uniref:hypothetical protein n=1 Tax=Vibrio splendidus TaxID=29497 RepID=UPI000C81DD62|nr:hypothetical protein [Vibrio splendidus]PMK03978.1 hypothetical protein BCU10_23350 [Vibrio splendidus]